MLAANIKSFYKSVLIVLALLCAGASAVFNPASYQTDL
jgi:hypothetical protein